MIKPLQDGKRGRCPTEELYSAAGGGTGMALRTADGARKYSSGDKKPTQARDGVEHPTIDAAGVASPGWGR